MITSKYTEKRHLYRLKDVYQLMKEYPSIDFCPAAHKYSPMRSPSELWDDTSNPCDVCRKSFSMSDPIYRCPCYEFGRNKVMNKMEDMFCNSVHFFTTCEVPPNIVEPHICLNILDFPKFVLSLRGILEDLAAYLLETHLFDLKIILEKSENRLVCFAVRSEVFTSEEELLFKSLGHIEFNINIGLNIINFFAFLKAQKNMFK